MHAFRHLPWEVETLVSETDCLNFMNALGSSRGFVAIILTIIIVIRSLSLLLLLVPSL